MLNGNSAPYYSRAFFSKGVKSVSYRGKIYPIKHIFSNLPRDTAMVMFIGTKGVPMGYGYKLPE